MFRSAPVRAVIFDLGHTLWDFAPPPDALRLRMLQLHTRLCKEPLEVPSPHELERALHEAFTSWYSESMEHRYAQPQSRELVQRAFASLDLTMPTGLLTEATDLLLATELQLPVVEPDTLAALGALGQRGIAMGCVTNTLLLQEGIEDIIDRLGLRRYLRCVVASSDVGYHKPHPSLFRRALTSLEVEAKQAVFVGDRLLEDVAGAKAVGMRGILTQQYRHDPCEVDVGPDAVISRLAELPRVLADWAGGN